MNESGLYFNEDSFNRLFPFFLQFSSDFKIVNFGRSLGKLCPHLKKGDSLLSLFTIQRPEIENCSFGELVHNYCNQFILIKCKINDVLLRGQFEPIDGNLIFVGSPWFTSMEETLKHKLTFDDFAHNDSSLDLLHIINNSENTATELKELVATVTAQRNQLVKGQEEIDRLAYVASASKIGVVFTKLDGKIFWCNDAFALLTGFSVNEIIGKTPVELGSNDRLDPVELKKMLSLFYKNNPFEVEILHARKNADPFWARVKGQPIHDKKGRPTQYFAILEDISLKKQYDQSIEAEKEKYRNIIANMNLGIIEVDLEDKIILANQSFVNMGGYSLDQLIGKVPSSLFLNDQTDFIKALKARLLSNALNESFELEVVDKNEQDKVWLVSGAANYDISGNVVGSIGIFLDITQQKQQEQQLYLLSLIAEKNINSVIICDATGHIEWANSSFLKMTGFSREEIIGSKPGHLLQGAETSKETVQYLRDQTLKGMPFSCEILNYTKNKSKYWVRIQGQALYDKNGTITKYFAIEEDITQQKNLEAQKEKLIADLAKTNKELEDYAQIVSHDLKSPLRSINSLISWIKEENSATFDEQTTKYFSLIEHKVEKMDHLIEGILTYSKIDKEASKRENVDTHEIVQSIIDIIHLPSHIAIEIEGVRPIIKADRFRVQQLFQNLLGNAVNYIDKEQGLVLVRAIKDDFGFIFEVQDNGVGMPKEIHSKIFDTFKSFTTSKHSTGLGLSIVKKIIDFYQGEIWLESQEGVGTTFYVKLKK